MKDRNGDFRMSYSQFECKEYVTEESVKCAFGGHYPTVHEVLPATVLPITEVSHEVQVSLTVSSNACEVLHEALVPSPVSFITCEVLHEAQVSSPAVSSSKTTHEEEIVEVNSSISSSIRMVDDIKEIDNNDSINVVQLNKHLSKIYSREDGKGYTISVQEKIMIVHCNICNVSVSLGENRGYQRINDHIETSRHLLNLSLISDLIPLDKKLTCIMDVLCPNNFVIPSVKGKSLFRCRLCNKDFKSEAKFLMSNVSQHVKSKEHHMCSDDESVDL